MRLLLGALILLSCFTAAALWQRSWTASARSNREPFPTSPVGSDAAQPGGGWSRVVLGRPSGGEPYSGSAEAAPQAPFVPKPDHPPPQPAPLPPAVDAVVTVQPGQTLSEICRERYGTARHGLVLAVARYNRLAGADEIREGQKILLPSSEKLLEDR